MTGFVKTVYRVVLLIILISSFDSILLNGFTDNDITNRTKGLPFMGVSAGAGIWHMSLQDGMQTRFMPFSVSLEYGRSSYPLSLVAGLFAFTTYNIDYFLLKPDYFLAGIQYAPLRGKPVSEKFNIYATGGINISNTRFTEEIYPGIISYENKVESQAGAGFAAALGAGYNLGSFEIKPMMYYFSGKARFFAGHFTKQTFNTGSLQLHLSLVYRFSLHKTGCPAYRKYYKF